VPSTTTLPRSGLTRRSSSSLCPVRHRHRSLCFSFPEGSLLTATQPAGAFTPVCSANHVPEYIAKLPELRAKGVDQVAVLAYNDAYVMSAWGKANGVTGDDIVRSTIPPGAIPPANAVLSCSSPTPRPSSPSPSAGPTRRAAPTAT
jgi:peroxiredoxin